jgi:hypothetical protein
VNTPLIAILHWHGFRRATPLGTARHRDPAPTGSSVSRSAPCAMAQL